MVCMMLLLYILELSWTITLLISNNALLPHLKNVNMLLDKKRASHQPSSNKLQLLQASKVHTAGG